MDFYQTLKEELVPFLLKLFHKVEEEGKLPNTFYKASITLPKPDKETTTTKNPKARKEPISLMNIDAKVCSKILVNYIQQYIKRIIPHDEVGIIPGIKGWFSVCKLISVIHHINKMEDEDHIDVEKVLNMIRD